MRAFYDELWERLPEALEPPDLVLRMGLLERELRAGLRVLDLGCGAGTFSERICRAGARAIAVDVADGALARTGRAVPEADLRRAEFDGPLPLSDGEVELVWASEVIEHVADTHLWLSEVRRVLVPGGRLLVTTPNHGRLALAVHGIERYSPPLGDHLHLYTRSSLRGTLVTLGFEAVSVKPRAGIPFARRILLARAVRP